jgi:hypothetical protein
MVDFYYKKDSRQRFWVACLSVFLLCQVVSSWIILRNDMATSYFDVRDNFYWTKYFHNPFTRFPTYLIGIIYGCSYFTFKYEYRQAEEETENDKELRRTNILIAWF